MAGVDALLKPGISSAFCRKKWRTCGQSQSGLKTYRVLRRRVSVCPTILMVNSDFNPDSNDWLRATDRVYVR
jgi:hypothetical protein